MNKQQPDWIHGLTDKLPKLTRRQTGWLVFAGIVGLVIVFVARSLGPKPSPSVDQSSNSGGVNIGSIGNVQGNVEIGLGVKGEFKGVTFLPITQLPRRLQQIKFDESEPTTTLRLISSRWNIDYEVTANNNTELSELARVISHQLSLYQHVEADVNAYPIPKGSFWMPMVDLMINGNPITGRESQTIADAKLNDGDLLQFAISWAFRVEMGTSDKPELPENQPPAGVVE
jgi:hypothetical protein